MVKGPANRRACRKVRTYQAVPFNNVQATRSQSYCNKAIRGIISQGKCPRPRTPSKLNAQGAIPATALLSSPSVLSGLWTLTLNQVCRGSPKCRRGQSGGAHESTLPVSGAQCVAADGFFSAGLGSSPHSHKWATACVQGLAPGTR